MSIIQVARQGTQFVVQENGETVTGLRSGPRGQVIKAALQHKENN